MPIAYGAPQKNVINSLRETGPPRPIHSISSINDAFSEDPLFEGIPDAFFEEIAPIIDDPIFEDIPDAFFDDVVAEPMVPLASHTASSEEDVVGNFSDDFFEAIPNIHIFPLGFPFLKLPPEIRNKIYDLLVVNSAYIGSTAMTIREFYEDVAKWHNTALSMTCRQIYDESANIFFVKNGFEFYCIRSFVEFMQGIGITRRRLLKKLKFNYRCGSPFMALRYIRSCTSLQELDISIQIIKPDTEEFQWPDSDSEQSGWLYRNQSWWLYPVKDPMKFFFANHSELSLGEGRGFGKASDAEASKGLVAALGAQSVLFEALQKVKHEAIHGPFRYFLTSSITNLYEMC